MVSSILYKPFEQLEINFAPRCDNGSLDGTALAYWYEHLKNATEQLGHPMTCKSHEIVAELQKARFAEVWPPPPPSK